MKKQAKKNTLFYLLPLFILLLIISIPIYQNHKTKIVPIKNLNIYNLDLNKHWQSLLKEMGSPQSVMLNDFKLSYFPNGQVDSYNLNVTGIHNGKKTNYQISFIPNEGLQITNNLIDENSIQENKVGADRFFEMLSKLDFESYRQANNYDYYQIISGGSLVEHSPEFKNSFLITEDGVSEFNDNNLPLRGYQFTLISMKKTDTNSYDSKEINYFFFDLVINSN